MPLNINDITTAYERFIQLRTAGHRYASFDYCYNYFHSFTNKRELASPANIEKSCLTLGFYLASWGMYRGSTTLLQRSLTNYKPLLQYVAFQCPSEAWVIDVNNYNDSSITILMQVYRDLRDCLQIANAQHLVLITKIMLGVFGNTPAFDNQFTKTFRLHFDRVPAFRSFNVHSLKAIKDFYDHNYEVIDALKNASHTFDFQTGLETRIHYTRVKIIDMIGFGHSLSGNNSGVQ